MHQPGHRTVTVLAQRIVRFARHPRELGRRRHHRPPQRLLRILGVDQAHVIRRDPDRQHGPAVDQRIVLGRRQVDHGGELIQRANPVPDLPPPVVPLRVRPRPGKTAPETPGSADCWTQAVAPPRGEPAGRSSRLVTGKRRQRGVACGRPLGGDVQRWTSTPRR